jgi:tetratricopeptide (TPR) repeat protein
VPDAVSEWSTTLALADKAVKMCPDNGVYRATRGAVLYRAGRWKDALGPLIEGHRSLQNDPNPWLRLDDARDCAYLAMAHHRLGHREEARKWFDTMVEQMEATMEEQRSHKVYFYWNTRKTMELLRPEAAQLLGITETPSPEDTKRSRSLAESASWQGDHGAYEEAVVELSQAIALTPDDVAWWYLRAEAEAAGGLAPNGFFGFWC